MWWVLLGMNAWSADLTVAVARLPLPAGKKLEWDDLSTVRLPEALVPPHAVVLGAELVGQTLAFPVAQQAPIVRQRLVGGAEVVAAEAVPEEGPVTVQVDRELGVLAAIVQAGDRVGFVRTTTRPACLVTWAEVVSRGSPVTLEVSSLWAKDLELASDAVVILPGPGSGTPELPPCREAP